MGRDRTHNVTVTADGPYLVEGGVKLAHQRIVTNAASPLAELVQYPLPIPSPVVKLCVLLQPLVPHALEAWTLQE